VYQLRSASIGSGVRSSRQWASCRCMGLLLYYSSLVALKKRRFKLIRFITWSLNDMHFEGAALWWEMFDAIINRKAPVGYSWKALLRLSLSMYAWQCLLTNIDASTHTLSHKHPRAPGWRYIHPDTNSTVDMSATLCILQEKVVLNGLDLLEWVAATLNTPKKPTEVESHSMICFSARTKWLFRNNHAHWWLTWNTLGWEGFHFHNIMWIYVLLCEKSTECF